MPAATIGLPSMSPTLPSPSESACWRWRSSAMKLQAGPEDRGLRLDVFLAQRLENLTRSQIQLLNRSGAVRIEGHAEKAGYRIRGGETIEIDFQALGPTPL